MEQITQQIRNDIAVWGVFYPDHRRMALWVKFTHPDRYKAQKVVNALLTLMEDPGQPERLELMRPANLPDSPIPQQRWPILLYGMLAGLGVGAIMAFFLAAPRGRDLKPQWSDPGRLWANAGSLPPPSMEIMRARRRSRP